jgi:hypothetical protein
MGNIINLARLKKMGSIGMDESVPTSTITINHVWNIGNMAEIATTTLRQTKW